MGCYVPRIPGILSATTIDPVGTEYTCISTPSSVANRPRTTQAYTGATITASATFVATATPAVGVEYVMYGCYDNVNIANALVNGQLIPAASLAEQRVTVGNCISYCHANGNKPWVGLMSNQAGTSSSCYCGDNKGTTVPVEPRNMALCNNPCSGTTQENCGANNGPILYAVAASATNVVASGWYSSWSAAFSFTPTYSCTPSKL